MAEHSPVPWTSTPWANTEQHEIAIHAADGTWVGDFVVDHDCAEETKIEANAEFALLAVNNHDALVAALRHAKNMLDIAQAAFGEDDQRTHKLMLKLMLEAYTRAKEVLKAVDHPLDPSLKEPRKPFTPDELKWLEGYGGSDLSERELWNKLRLYGTVDRVTRNQFPDKFYEPAL